MSLKAKETYRWVIEHDYDWVFHCGRDTYVRPEKLKIPAGDYEGFVLTGESYCSGGAGVWLSKRAMQIVVAAPVSDLVDDRWVGHILAQNGITPIHSRAYMPFRVPITQSNDVVSVHLSQGTGNYDPQWMHSIHQEWFNSK